jgi:predicted nucleic acid-binding protein
VILADSSIWIDHLRSSSVEMARLVDRGKIVTHPYVVAQIALGSLRDRVRTLRPLEQLRQVRVAHIDEVRSMIERHSLYSRGIGLVDAHLLASCLITPGTRLWTRDGRLRRAAQALGVHADLPPFTAN